MWGCSGWCRPGARRASPPGMRAAASGLRPRWAAAKTGTTGDWRDNWTVGYTPDFVTGVWVGNSDNSAMRNSTGVTGAAPIWHDVMERISQGRPDRTLPRPPDLQQVEICAPSGL